MSKESSNKREGWIETFYGDHWVKRKKLIIGGLFLPLVFSFFLLLEMNCILSIACDFPYDYTILYNRIKMTIGIVTIGAIFLVSIIFFIFYLRHITSSHELFKEPLKAIHQEIFVQKKPDAYMILVKNFCISCIHSLRKTIHLFLFLFGSAIVFIPSITVGYLIYTWVDLFFLPEMANFLTLIPTVGDVLSAIVMFIYESVGSELGVAFQNIPLVYHVVLLTLPMLLLFAISDRIETSVRRRQRGNIRNIFRNGLKNIIEDLDFPKKIANFFYTTLLCLFTDQHCVSLDIFVINSRNVELAMHGVLGRNQKCYTAKLPLNPEKILSEIKKFPDAMLSELESVLGEISEGVMGKLLKAMLESEEWRARIERQTEYLVKVVKNVNVIVGVNEEGVMAYAIINTPPPTYMTRIVTRFWCSDPTVKSRIIDEISRLEFM